MTCRKLLAVFWACAAIASAEDDATLLAEAKSHYVKRSEPAEVDAALKLFERVLEADPANYEAAWQLSRAFWYKGNHAVPDQKKEHFEQGKVAGENAVRINASGCEGHFWLGVNQALLAENSGKINALGMVDDVKRELHKALELNADCECAGPQRVLGKFYSEIPWFKGGSDEKGIEYLNESLRRCPEDTQSRMFLAEIYLNQGQKGLAIQQLELVLKQEPDPEWYPETIENKNKAEKRLQELGSK